MTIDKSGLNLAALKAINAKRKTPIKIRQRKYLNNLVEQDHRRDQAANAANDGLQEFSLRTHHPWWNRDHAYNSQRSKRLL
ncbi:transposase-like protein [Robbsia andropogonis]